MAEGILPIISNAAEKTDTGRRGVQALKEPLMEEGDLRSMRQFEEYTNGAETARPLGFHELSHNVSRS